MICLHPWLSPGSYLIVVFCMYSFYCNSLTVTIFQCTFSLHWNTGNTFSLPLSGTEVSPLSCVFRQCETFFEKILFLLAKVAERPKRPHFRIFRCYASFLNFPSVFSKNSVLRAKRAPSVFLNTCEKLTIFRHYASVLKKIQFDQSAAPLV